MVGEEGWAGKSMIVEVKCVNVPKGHVWSFFGFVAEEGKERRT